MFVYGISCGSTLFTIYITQNEITICFILRCTKHQLHFQSASFTCRLSPKLLHSATQESCRSYKQYSHEDTPVVLGISVNGPDCYTHTLVHFFTRTGNLVYSYSTELAVHHCSYSASPCNCTCTQGGG